LTRFGEIINRSVLRTVGDFPKFDHSLVKNMALVNVNVCKIMGENGWTLYVKLGRVVKRRFSVIACDALIVFRKDLIFEM